MKLTAQLTAIRLFEALATMGVLADPGAVNRVVIDARRGQVVTVHVETLAETARLLPALREAPLLDGTPLDPP